MADQSQWRSLQAPFVRGSDQPALMPRTGLPLDRLLPPYFEGMATEWVKKFVPPGSWILDPFGQDPFSILELARSGYRVLVTSNNPIPAFILELMASAPSSEEWGDALLALANLTMQDGTRLEDYIEAFYQIECPNPDCPKGTAEIERFIWHEGETDPASAIINCSACGLTQELPITPAILSQLPTLPSFALYRARALELAAPLDDPLRPVMEDVIKYYSPLSLVLLQIILNKLDHPSLSTRQKILNRALLLTTADQTNQLWAYPLGRNRPKQLVRPPVYQEPNLWQALLRSKDQWTLPENAIPVKNWPELPPLKGGVSLFRGRLRELTPKPGADSVALVYTSLPRRNQAYWNLSGLWSGWLWGRESISALRNTLLKQRYDWTWHTKSLSAVLQHLARLISTETPVLLQIGELDQLFLLAGILGAQDAGLKLNAVALDGEATTLQTQWQIGQTAQAKTDPEEFSRSARESAIRYLADRGEPAPYLPLFSATILGLQTEGRLAGQPELQPNGTLNELEAQIDKIISSSSAFSRFNPGVTADAGQYWLSQPVQNKASLADQAEGHLLSKLQTLSTMSLGQIYQAVNEKLPGFLTPEDELISAILESYAVAKPGMGHPEWHLLEGEDDKTRQKDLQEMERLIINLAERLDYEIRTGKGMIQWLDADGQEVYSFFTLTTTMISQLVQGHAKNPGRKLIVLPGSRSNLISFKLKRDPNLQQLVKEDWQFVKFRQMRNLNENPLLSRELFASQIVEDPPEFRSSQLALF